MVESTTVTKPKRTGKWADKEFVRKYQRQWRLKNLARLKAKDRQKTLRKSAKVKVQSIDGGQVEDAIIYLRQAVAKMENGRESWSDLLAKLALKTLEGK